MIPTTRHDAFFNHAQFLEPIHVIGVGGLGSYTAQQLGKLGCGRVNELHLWDGDIVEETNLANQAFSPDDVGLNKALAKAAHLQQLGSCNVHVHSRYIEKYEELSGVVFLCVDSMRVRREIWEQSLRFKPVSLLIEMRMDAVSFIIHTLDPKDERHVAMWEHGWYSDEDGHNVAPGCGRAPAVGPSASLTADFGVWQFIRAARIASGVDDELANQLIFSLLTFNLQAKYW